MEPIHKFQEYYSALIKCELAMNMARIYKEPVNSKVSKCALVVSKQCKDSRNKKLFIGVSKSEFSAASIYQMRTMFDEQISL